MAEVNEPVMLDIPLLRVDDLVSLKIRAVNLRLDTENPNQGPALISADAERESLLVVRFPPQTIFEQAFLESGSDAMKQPLEDDPPPPPTPPADPILGPALPPGQVACRMGGETRLVFRVPPDARIPYTIAGLLEWTGLPLVVTPIGDVEAGMDPPPEPLTIRPPTDYESTLQLPFRMHLSPTHNAAWEHATEPVFHDGRAELWHTRIVADEDHPVGLRAIWSPDYRPGQSGLNPAITGLGTLAPMSINDRHQIVILTSAFTGYAVSSRRRYVPQPVQASLVMLSGLGGWLHSFGHWDPPAPIKPRRWWLEVIAGVDPGRLDPLQQPEGLAELTLDRIMPRGPESPAPAPALAPAPEHDPEAERAVDVANDVDAAAQALNVNPRALSRLSPFGRREIDPDAWTAFPLYDLDETKRLDLSEWAHVASQGRDHYVRIVYEGHLADTGHRSSLVKVTERRIEQGDAGPVAWLRQYYYIVVKVPERRYAADGLSPRGREMPLRTITLTTKVTPHIDYPYAAPCAITDRSFWVRVKGSDFLFTGTVRGADGQVSDFSKPMIFVPDSEAKVPLVRAAMASLAGRHRLQAKVPGQRIAFADPEGGGHNTVFATEAFMLGDRTVIEKIDPAKNYAGYRSAFFEPILLKADVHIPAAEALTGSNAATSIALDHDYIAHGFDAVDNETGVFGTVVKLTDKGSAPVEVTEAGSPATFTAAKAGGVATPSLTITTLTRGQGPLGGKVADAKANVFAAADVFPTGAATLFGAFDLAALLPAVGLTVEGQAPKMTVKQVGATKLVTTLDWSSTIDEEKEFGLVSFVPKSTTLKVEVTITAEPGADAATLVDGKLTAFDIVFLLSLEVRFKSFHFVSLTGAKPTATVELDDTVPVRFIGDLAFVEELRALIPPGVFGPGVSVDLIDNPVGLRAGLAMGLPPAEVGVFGLKNISFSAGLTLPFTDGKPVVDLGFASRGAMFQLSVLIFGGGGFFHVELDTDGMRMLEAAFEFGAVAALDIGVASGEVHIMAGIYFAMEMKQIEGAGEELAALLSGYLRCGGSLSVLGLVRISVEFYLSFTYYPDPGDDSTGKAKGRATLTVEVEVACFSKSIELTVEKSFGGEGSDPSFLNQFETPALWAEYADAFA